MAYVRTLSLPGLLVAAVIGCGDTTPAAPATLPADKDAAGSVDGSTLPVPDTAPDVPEVGPVADSGDPFVPEEGKLGWPCTSNEECFSGFCIESTGGFICTETCLSDCPKGFSCKSVVNTRPDIVFVCVPNVLKLCQACQTDKQCNGGLCLAIEEETGTPGAGAVAPQTYCTGACGPDSPCPTDYFCKEIINQQTGGPETVCLPKSGSCSCTDADKGIARTCKATNEIGECLGFQVCQGAAGWGLCGAQTPTNELCDGVDNDCDGLIDEGAADGEPCSETNVHGVCDGVLTCLGEQGAICSAQVPGPETCDYKDNDCNGETDEAFKTGGSYASDAHCGECNKSCGGAIANAVATCNAVDYAPPACVVDQCVAGFYQVNPFLCSPVPGALCDSCTSDENCAMAKGKCVEMNDGEHCAVPCGEGESCPIGYLCTPGVDPEGGLLCMPETGACGCDGSNLSLQKACEVTWQDPADPVAPVVTCQGVEKCTADGWGGCELPDDQCDGIDNDCDGVVDGPWINGAGIYDKDQNCGICGNNCAATPYANASGVCDTSGIVPACDVDCADGWFDVNGNPVDGCECLFTSETDHPDGPDQNCDGIDGEVLNGIFVSKTGDDGNPGTIDAPVLTIQTGIKEALAQGKRDVYVTTGVFAQNVTLASGVAVYGGYRGDYLERDTSLFETVILGDAPTAEQPAAVNAKNLNGAASKASRLDGFTIFGFDNKTPGGSSYGLWLVDCGDQLTVKGNRIFAGNGGNGKPGTPGTSGAIGQDGITGKGAYDIGTSVCSVKHHNDGGFGGQRTCGVIAVNGGGGGDAVCPNFDEESGPASCPAQPFAQSATPAEHGAAGQGPKPGIAGLAGRDAYIDRKYGPYNDYACNAGVDSNCTSCLLPPGFDKHGHPGSPGKDGINGAKGAACNNIEGIVQGHLWKPTGGAAAKGGTHGSGGGGGGAAGGVETRNCTSYYALFSDIGGSGGGGGSGGCSGTEGQAGKGGGGSFAILLSWSGAPATTPSVTGNIIVRGSGGVGGNGGPGGTGGPGGAGGDGGPSGQSVNNSFCTAGGGNGGVGGNGGHGGGGGGGCGGVSFGIYVSGADGVPGWKSLNTFDSDGGPGAGGASLGAPGDDGLIGASGATNF